MTPGAHAGATSAFDHDVRVILCDECGAPLPAPLDGGKVSCQFCRATFDLVARAEIPLRAYRSIGLDESRRIEALRKQDGEPLYAPPGIEGLVDGGALVPGRIADAEGVFRTVRLQATTKCTVEGEDALLFLARLIVGYHLEQRDYERLRATLEAALEVARSPRARQTLYAFLSRSAARNGDLSAAEAWLAPCDPTPQHLEMDTTYRVARAYLSTVKHDYQDVLSVLGDKMDAVPIGDTTECFASVLRANALEHTDGPEFGAFELQRACKTNSYFVAEACCYNNPTLDLCPQSLPLVRRKLPFWSKSLVPLPLGCTALYLLVVGALLFTTVSALVAGDAELGTPLQLVAALVSLPAIPVLFIIIRLRINEFRRRRAAKSRAYRSGDRG